MAIRAPGARQACLSVARNFPPSATKDQKVPSLAPTLQHRQPLPRSRSSLRACSAVGETDLQPMAARARKPEGSCSQQGLGRTLVLAQWQPAQRPPLVHGWAPGMPISLEALGSGQVNLTRPGPGVLRGPQGVSRGAGGLLPQGGRPTYKSGCLFRTSMRCAGRE